MKKKINHLKAILTKTQNRKQDQSREPTRNDAKKTKETNNHGEKKKKKIEKPS